MDRRGLGLIDRIDPPPIPSPGLICVVHRILIKIDCNKNTDKTDPRPTPHTVHSRSHTLSVFASHRCSQDFGVLLKFSGFIGRKTFHHSIRECALWLYESGYESWPWPSVKVWDQNMCMGSYLIRLQFHISGSSTQHITNMQQCGRWRWGSGDIGGEELATSTAQKALFSTM